MPPAATACPFCKTPLRTSAPLPPGKSVKCPRCAKVFAIPATAAAPAGWAPPAAPKKASPSGGGHIRKPPAPAAVPVARVPVRPVRQSAQGVRKRKGNGLLIAGLLALFVLILGGGGAAGYFLFLKPKPDGDSQASTTQPADSPTETTSPATKPMATMADTGKAPPTTAVKPPPPPPPPPPPVGPQLVAFMPADSNFIAGVDVSALLKNEAVAAQLEPLLDNEMLKALVKETGLEVKDLFDQFVVAIKTPPGGQGAPEAQTVAMKTKMAFNRSKVLDALADGAGKKAKDKEYYATKAAPFTHVYVPSDRIVVLTSLPSEKFEPLVAGDGMKPALDGPTLALVRKAERSPVWMVMAIDEEMRKEAQKGLEPVAEMAPPEVKPLLAAVPQLRGVAFWGNVDEKELRVNLAIDLTDAKTAKEATSTLQGLWNKQVKELVKTKEVEERLKAAPAFIQELAKDVLDNTKIAQLESVADLSVKLRIEPLEALAKEIKEKGPEAVFAALLKPPDATPDAPPAKPGEFAEAEKDLLTLINEARDREKLPPFKADPKLIKAAQSHSENMAKQMKLAHDLDGKNFGDRIEAAGYKFQIANEYVLRGTGKIAGKSVYETIINNDEARKLLLDKQFDETGISFARNAKDEVYITIKVASPQK